MRCCAGCREGRVWRGKTLVEGAQQPAGRFDALAWVASSSGKPVLLRLDCESGHGIGSTKTQVFDERANVFAFLMWPFGMPRYAPKP